MKPSDRDNYVECRIEKAKDTFEVAELLFENNKWNSAINRLYYAAYYAVSGLLIKSAIESRRTSTPVSSDKQRLFLRAVGLHSSINFLTILSFSAVKFLKIIPSISANALRSKVYCIRWFSR